MVVDLVNSDCVGEGLKVSELSSSEPDVAGGVGVRIKFMTRNAIRPATTMDATMNSGRVGSRIGEDSSSVNDHPFHSMLVRNQAMDCTNVEPCRDACRYDRVTRPTGGCWEFR